MTVNTLILFSVFAGGIYYEERDWLRLIVVLVCGVLIWMLRDELRSRA